MARRILHLIVQQEEPSRDSLWINPYNGVARIYAQNKGWIELQGPLFAQIGAAVSVLEKDVAALGEDKQDVLTAGANISIKDGVISATDTKPYVVMDALPKMPAAGDADSIFLVPDGDGAFGAWVWDGEAWGRVGDAHEELTASDVDEMWDGTD